MVRSASINFSKDAVDTIARPSRQTHTVCRLDAVPSIHKKRKFRAAKINVFTVGFPKPDIALVPTDISIGCCDDVGILGQWRACHTAVV